MGTLAQWLVLYRCVHQGITQGQTGGHGEHLRRIFMQGMLTHDHLFHPGVCDACHAYVCHVMLEVVVL